MWTPRCRQYKRRADTREQFRAFCWRQFGGKGDEGEIGATAGEKGKSEMIGDGFRGKNDLAWLKSGFDQYGRAAFHLRAELRVGPASLAEDQCGVIRSLRCHLVYQRFDPNCRRRVHERSPSR